MKRILLLLLVVTNLVLAQKNASSKLHTAKSDAGYTVLNSVFQPQLEEFYIWDSVANKWGQQSDSIVIAYNLAGMVVREMHYYGAIISYVDTFLYNTNGKKIKDIRLGNLGGTWDTSRVESFSYNSDNQIIVDLAVDYNNGVPFAYASKNLFTYNGNKQLVSNEYQYWDQGAWVNSGFIIYSYLGNGQLNMVLSKDWNKQKNKYVKRDSVTSISFYAWTGNIDDAKPSSYTISDTAGVQYADTFSYDVNGNQIKEIDYVGGTKPWAYDYKQTNTYSYDSNKNITQRTEFNYRNGNATAIANDGSKTVYGNFKLFATGINPIALEKTLDIFPNPSTGTFTIPVVDGAAPADVKIYVIDTFGKEVYHTSYNGPINLSEQPDGLYFLTLIRNGTKTTSKLILSK